MSRFGIGIDLIRCHKIVPLRDAGGLMVSGATMPLDMTVRLDVIEPLDVTVPFDVYALSDVTVPQP